MSEADIILFVFHRFSCPACGKEFAYKLSPVLLGTGRRRCAGCGLVFADGCKEWPELSRLQKLQYFVPHNVLFFVGGAVLIAVFSAAIAIFGGEGEGAATLSAGCVILIMFVGPWVPYFVLQGRHIPKSKARFERKPAFGHTDEFIL